MKEFWLYMIFLGLLTGAITVFVLFISPHCA
jgi:hypothetical protein